MDGTVPANGTAPVNGTAPANDTVQPARGGTAGPPGPDVAGLAPLAADPPGFLCELRARYGPLVRLPLGAADVFLVSDPADIQDVLVTSARSFGKGIPLPDGGTAQPLEALLGRGLLTSTGDFHRSQRRLMQPVFHRARVVEYGTAFAELSERYADGLVTGRPVDVRADMAALTLAIVARTLFGVDVDHRVVRTITATFGRNEGGTPGGALLFVAPRPAPSADRIAAFTAGRDDLFRAVDALIAERRAEGATGGDLLSLLLSARDADTGRAMDDRQVRDEALTILMAGHETTANALTWTFHLLADAPEATAELTRELDEVLGGRLPAVDDLPRLTWTDQVLSEAMRLYPPAWLLTRHTVTPHRLGGYDLPARSVVLMSPFAVHRDPALWPDPDRFDPARWGPGGPAVAADRPRFAYFPFGGGARQCIGNGFARMEGVLALATIARRARYEREEGAAPVRTLPSVTLRPLGELRMVPRLRV